MSEGVNRIVVLKKEQFDVVYHQLGVNPRIDKDYIYDLYLDATNNAQAMMDANVLGRFIPLNPIVLILYLVHECGYLLDATNKTCEELKKNDIFHQKIVSASLDKYFTNEHLSLRNESAISKYMPQISTPTIYLNFIIGALNRYAKKSPKETLIIDIMKKGFLMMKAIDDLMVNGFATEAFSTWRTLHETECILKLLDSGGQATIDAYLKHMNYAMAFRGAIPSKEKTDEVFVQIKSEMAEHGLKSKDMKKFIEYGWLYSLSPVEEIKLNFRDGVEKVAKLSNYSRIYEMASEIAHSSPILIYSRPNYFFHLTLINMYESFFRMEEMFKKFFMNSASEKEQKHYLLMRKVYLSEMLAIHEHERKLFSTLGKTNPDNSSK